MRLFSLLLLLVFLVVPSASKAENEKLMKMLNSRPLALYDYKQATLKNFSQLYWALSRLDITNDQFIDNYMLINECDIYKNYFQNEFEWNSIRQYARQHIEQNKEKFPLRFEFIQPLRLGPYDFEKQGFKVAESYEIDGIRRFEIQSLDFYEKTCGYEGDVVGYPKSLIVELSRPVFFEILPMHPDKANEYLNEKTVEFKKLATGQQQDYKVYNFRDIYLVLKVKFFASAGDYSSKVNSTLSAKVLGVLESIEIYDDLERKKLLFSENYQRNKNKETTQLKVETPAEDVKPAEPAPAVNTQPVIPMTTVQ